RGQVHVDRQRTELDQRTEHQDHRQTRAHGSFKAATAAAVPRGRYDSSPTSTPRVPTATSPSAPLAASASGASSASSGRSVVVSTMTNHRTVPEPRSFIAACSAVASFAEVVARSASQRCAATTSGRVTSFGRTSSTSHERSWSARPSAAPNSTVVAKPPVPRPTLVVTEHAVRVLFWNCGATFLVQSVGSLRRSRYGADVSTSGLATSYRVK